MNNDLNEIIKALKYLMEVTEEDGLVTLSESFIEQMAETEGGKGGGNGYQTNPMKAVKTTSLPVKSY